MKDVTNLWLDQGEHAQRIRNQLMCGVPWTDKEWRERGVKHAIWTMCGLMGALILGLVVTSI
jgi:hypothetical protein